MLDAVPILSAIRSEEPRRGLYRLIQAELQHRDRESVAVELSQFITVAKATTITAEELELLQWAYNWLSPYLFSGGENEL